MQKFEIPFVHYICEDFLNDFEYKQVSEFYAKQRFYPKHTDLFHFFQTNELNNDENLNFFRYKLNSKIEVFYRTSEKTWFNFFASYYFKDNYLLCHDDLVEDRKFAFSYYLEDFKSGELILYDNYAEKEVKRIAVKKNLLVMFEVSETSYHEVNNCSYDGRKAITGWFNVKGCNKISYKSLPTIFNIVQQTEFYPLEIDLDEDFIYVPEISYPFNVKSSRIQGPFYSRKLKRLVLTQNIGFSLLNFEIFHMDFYEININDYILLNDKINEPKGDILDLWIIKSEETGEERDDLIKYVNVSGDVAEVLPLVNEGLFILRRKDRKVFIERSKRHFFLAHFMYKPKSNSI